MDPSLHCQWEKGDSHCPWVLAAEPTPPADTAAPESLNQQGHWGGQAAWGLNGSPCAITDLRTWPKEGQEYGQQNQSVEDPQDGENSQDSKEVSGRQKGYRPCQCGRQSSTQQTCPAGVIYRDHSANSAQDQCGTLFFFNPMTLRTTFCTLQC